MTTSDYLTQLQADKQTLVTNLNAKGVEATNDETFTTLVPKVAEIQSGEIISPSTLTFREQSKTSFNVNVDTSNLTTMAYMFFDCKNLQEINLSNWITNKVTTMESMFRGCSSLTNAILNFDTSKVSSMYATFYGCTNLSSLNLNNWNVNNVTTMNTMFSGCSSLASLDLSSWFGGKNTNMSQTFSGCSSLTTLDLSNFDTSKVINMPGIFSSCNNLKNLKIKIKNCNCSVSGCPLTTESVAYILQNLGLGVTDKTLTLGATNLAKATETDLASATEKGWTVN